MSIDREKVIKLEKCGTAMSALVAPVPIARLYSFGPVFQNGRTKKLFIYQIKLTLQHGGFANFTYKIASAYLLREGSKICSPQNVKI